jgi:hypothetical protein
MEFSRHTTASRFRRVANRLWIGWCPGPELNRHVPFGTRDFKSRASANFATRALRRIYRIIQDLIYYHPFSRLRLSCPGVTGSFLCGTSLLN